MDSARGPRGHTGTSRPDVGTALLVGVMAAMNLVALLLLARRIAGALVQPLDGLTLLAVTGLAILLVLGWRLGWEARGGHDASVAWIPRALPGIVLYVLLYALSLPGTSTWAVVLAWLAYLTTELTWWWLAYSSPRPRAVPPPAIPVTTSRPIAENAADNDTQQMGDDVIQQLTRSRQGDQERIASRLRIPFVASQRIAVTHLAFCPPLEGIPQLAAEVTDGPAATVTIASPQAFGARVEVRLTEPAERACTVVVEVDARRTALTGRPDGPEGPSHS